MSLCFHLRLSVCLLVSRITTFGWIIIVSIRKQPIHFWYGPRSGGGSRNVFSLFLTLGDKTFFNIFIISLRILHKSSWRKPGMFRGTGIYECVQFNEVPNKNLDRVYLNVVSQEDCWALESYVLSLSINITTINSVYIKFSKVDVFSVLYKI